MTFGEQNSLSQSFKLLDKAFDSGINFFDSAEMYPVPQHAETQGRSEEYFGCWLRERKIPRERHYLIINHIGAIRSEHDDFTIRFASAMNHPIRRSRCCLYLFNNMKRDYIKV
ncbi:unnamed protein product [Lactuca virosa]|uniref:NADP-dependent oxidoreductase domain-containing protein n=1 Tax=Lactuca virosa TaxID=75947 RepID=A0AAU9MQP1_9ASTR|nr:unnamed protein product [Lactuca virosa]